MPKLTALSSLGLAKESTYGTPVAATSFLPFKNPNIGDDFTILKDEGFRGMPAGPLGAYQGVATSHVEFEGDFYPTDPAHLFMGLLGADTLVGAADPFSHTLKLAAAQPPSYTITDEVADTVFRQYPGSMVYDLALKFTPLTGLTYAAKAMGLKSATTSAPTETVQVATSAESSTTSVWTITTSAAHGLSVGDFVTLAGITPTAYNGTWQVATVTSATIFTINQTGNPGNGTGQGTATRTAFDTQPYFLGWQCAVAIGGVANAKVTGMDLKLSRSATPIFGANNTQSPAAIFLGPLAVAGSASLYYDDDTELLRYLNNTQGALAFTFDRGVTPARQLVLTMSLAAFEKGAVNRGKEYVETDINFEAIANAGDGSLTVMSPIQVLAKNSRSTAY
jgi:hypothetical protein